MRAVLIALILLTVSADALATGAAWERKRVVIKNYLSEDWRPFVAPVVAAFNDAMPKRVPTLRYREHDPTACADIPRQQRRTGIVLCWTTDTPNGLGATYPHQRRHVIDRAQVRLKPETGWGDDRIANTVCHELMHALTGIPDNYDFPQRERSCVWGLLPEPGPFDVRYARRVYRQHGRH